MPKYILKNSKYLQQIVCIVKMDAPQDGKRPRIDNDEETPKTNLVSEETVREIFRWCMDNTHMKKALKPPKKNPKTTLLHYASEKGHKFLIDILLDLDDFDVNAMQEDGQTPLVIAIKNDQVDIAHYLIEKGANINTGKPETPLNSAIKRKNIAMAKFLIEKGANVLPPASSRGKHHEFENPLKLASSNCLEEIVALLVEKGADVNEGVRPAIAKSNFKIAKYLIQKGAYPTSSLFWITQFVFASDFPEHTDIIVELTNLVIERGANINERDQIGCTSVESPLLYAVEKSKGQMNPLIKLLLDKGARIKISDITWMLNIHQVEVAKFLIDNISTSDLLKISYVDDRDKEILHLVVTRGYYNEAKILIEKGANIELKDRYGYTPLEVAVHNGHISIVKLLIEKGSKINDQNGWKETPLHFALKRNKKEIIELLLQNGANMDLKNEDGKTPKDIAIESKDLELIVLFHEAEKKSKGQDISKAKPNDCIVCFNPRKGIFAFLPCGHAMTCENCSKDIIASSDKPECPTCRQPVTVYQNIFM